MQTKWGSPVKRKAAGVIVLVLSAVQTQTPVGLMRVSRPTKVKPVLRDHRHPHKQSGSRSFCSDILLREAELQT